MSPLKVSGPRKVLRGLSISALTALGPLMLTRQSLEEGRPAWAQTQRLL